MSSTGVSLLGKNGTALEAIASTSNALSVNLAVNNAGTLAVSDSVSQGSLSTIATEVTSLDNKAPSLGQANKAGSVPVTLASDQGSLSVSDSAAQASLSTIATETTSIDNKTPSLGQAAKASSVPVTLASDQGSLSVSDSASQASLSSIDSNISTISGKTPSLGQAVKASSVPVVLASDQGNLAVSMGSLSASATTTHSGVSVSNSSTSTSSAVDLNAVREVSVFGNITEQGSEIDILVSSDDSNYFKRTDVSLISDYSSGNFGKAFKVNARYLKVRYVNDSGSSQTLTSIVSHKS